MDVLFVHPNFPGQFRLLAAALAKRPDCRVYTLRDASWVPRQLEPSEATHWSYEAPEPAADGVHAYLRSTDAAVRRGQSVVKFLLKQKHEGFDPDVIYVHPGWGDGLYLKDLFPDARVVALMEYFYAARGADVGFDKEFPLSFDDIFRVRTMNLVQHMALEGSDLGLCPTQWQRARYPAPYQPQLQVLHEGIDTQVVCPDASARLQVPECEWKLGSQTIVSPGIELQAGDEVLTYASRGLEPYRGIHNFIRALPTILQERPGCHVLVMGKLSAAYGPAPRHGGNWRDVFLNEVAHQISPEQAQRIHFTGPLPYAQYLQALRISRAHVYLTYPFILSWSLLEAMACGCLVIASDTAPVQEVVQHDANGLLVPFDQPQALASQVTAALANPQTHQHLRLQARQTIAEHFDFERVVLPEHLRLLAQRTPYAFDLPATHHDEALH